MLRYNTIIIDTSTYSDFYVNFPHQILVSRVCHVFNWWHSLKRTILCNNIVMCTTLLHTKYHLSILNQLSSSNQKQTVYFARTPNCFILKKLLSQKLHIGCVSESGDFATLFFPVRQHWGGCRYRHFVANFKAF
jgi:hypothetical protein